MYDLRFIDFVSVCMIPDEESVTLKAFKSRLRSRLWVLGLQLDGLVDNLMLLCTRQAAKKHGVLSWQNLGRIHRKLSE